MAVKKYPSSTAKVEEGYFGDGNIDVVLPAVFAEDGGNVYL